MARTAGSLSADRIRIEDEVWEEAFAYRVRSRPARPARTSAPVRPTAPSAPVRAANPTPPAAPVTLSARAISPPAGGGARRTVQIQGRGAERSLRYTPAPRDRFGSSPDRLAMWAVLLGFVLVLVAILSSHF